ncbi:amino acid exporter (AAE family) [Anaerobacterium chartisolvens]|uniref:Amino acid exporter (AAE family) n=1 Tax=Anaerobacterium chartisolvens TaxID=1297424 RepID=A0A369B0B2_9FIRM|nr:L-methionine/branched-chain amino acid transporter [Anaerobacterium chartisolvens]RCX14853.1 amino acid exporter (AAE family) [Anaerobacterium chartisolvens]
MSSLKKSLNLYQGIGILVSTLLGSGIFLIPAIVSSIAGTKSAVSWLLMILIILPIALTFSSLGIVYPNAGGTAFFIRNAFGKRFENFTSWLYLSVVSIGPPVVIITGANYLGSIINANKTGVFIISVGMLLIMLLINLQGIELTGNIQTIISIVIVAVILIMAIFSLAKEPLLILKNTNFKLEKGDISIILESMGIVFWCFVGIEALAHLAPEFKNIEKDFPKTVIISILLVGFLCLLLSLIVLQYHAYGNESLNAGYVAYIINIMIGGYGKNFASILGFITCFATVNVYILSFSRQILSMSQNKVLPAFFLKTTSRNVPINATIPCFLLVLITIAAKFALNINLNELILYANGIFISVYLLASVSGLVLLSGFKKIIALLATIFCLSILMCIGTKAIYAIIVLIFSVFWDYARELYLSSQEKTRNF